MENNSRISRLMRGSGISAIKISAIYLTVSILWIFLTDQALLAKFADEHLLTRLQTIKGWFFVSMSAVIIFFLIRAEIRKKNTIFRTINESERWQNVLLANIPSTTSFLMDPSLNYILVQGNELEKLGYKNSDFIGKNFSDIPLKDQTRIAMLEKLREVREGKTVILEVQNGDNWYEFRASPVTDKNGELIAYAVLMINITEQKNVISELREAQLKAEDNNRLKTDFIENISHELRTPLNSIIGFSDLVFTRNLSENKKQVYRTFIRESSNQLIGMIDNILLISELEKGLVEKRFQKFPLHEECEQIIQHFGSLLLPDKKNIKIRPTFPKEKKLVVTTDKNKLYQIIFNLLDNSIKFTNDGFIEFGYQPEENGQIFFYVQDSGIGINPEDFHIIFERFRKGKDEKEILYRGTGLGLSIVKELVKLLGGEVWFTSRKGMGSCFMFSIPVEIHESDWEMSSSFDLLVPIILRDSLLLQNEKLLQDLRRNKFLIVTSRHESHALMESGQGILLMDGSVLDDEQIINEVKHLRTEYPQIPIIYLAQEVRPEQKEALYTAGIHEYWTHPLNREEVELLGRKYTGIRYGKINPLH